MAYGNVDFAAAGSASRVKKLTIINLKKYEATAVISAIVASPGFTVDPACNNVTDLPDGITRVVNLIGTGL